VAVQSHHNRKLSRTDKLVSSSAAASARRCTYGEVIEDFSIDLIGDGQRDNLLLCVSDGKKETVMPEFEIGEHVFYPGNLPIAYRDAIRFPGRSAEFGSGERLFAELIDLFSSCGLQSTTASRLALFALASWFSDVLAAAPTLFIAGWSPEAEFLLDMLWCVVRRGLHISEFTQRVLCSLPMEVHPTLLINAGEISAASLKLLRTTNRRRACVPQKGKLVNLYCAKCIYIGPIGDGSANSVGFQIALPPPSGTLPTLDERRCHELTQTFQTKLLTYRLRNILRVRDSQFDAVGLTPHSRMLARIFGAPLLGVPALESHLMQVLEEHEDEARDQAMTDFNSVVLEAAIQNVHTKPGDYVFVGEIAETANSILRGRGDVAQHHAREVGAILSSFGLKKKRKPRGESILLDSTVAIHLHQLARQLGVLNTAPKGQCALCEQNGADSRRVPTRGKHS
jgi:hypothetical protein